MTFFHGFAALLFCFALGVKNVQSQPENGDSACKEALLSHLDGKSNQQIKNCPITSKLINWIALQRSDHNLSFKEAIGFMVNNPHWPNQSIMGKNAELAIDEETPPAQLREWFSKHPPLTTYGALVYAKALTSGPILTRHVKSSWRRMDFSADQQQDFLEGFRHLLSHEDHTDRLERLLWDKEVEQVGALLPYLSDTSKEIALIRLDYQNGIERELPDHLLTHEGVVFDRVHSLRKAQEFDKAAFLILSAPISSEHADLWWTEQNFIAREFLEQHRYREALDLISKHKLKSGKDFAAAEWLSGWINLRFLKNSNQALEHFHTLFSRVKSPVSIARAGYWLGRAYETIGDKNNAAHWYNLAGKHTTTFYGQLSASKLLKTPWPELKPVASIHEGSLQNEVLQALSILMDVGLPALHWTRPFAINLGLNADSLDKKHTLLKHLSEIAPHEVVWFAKKAGATSHLTLLEAYPCLKEMPKKEDLPELALSHAIAYRESHFDPYAVSYAGAKGLMQIRPGTASDAARSLGVEHSEKRLTSDPAHNLLLGSYYLSALLKRFDGSYILALAAYNAGPVPVESWIERFGDPRSDEIDVIDWIELIPYHQTRDYVQRVLENVGPYRSILYDSVEHTIIHDLQR